MTGPHIEVRRSGVERIEHGVLAILAVGLGGCALLGGQDELEPTQSTPTLADDWTHAILDMGRIPVLPLTEDMYVGDVYVLPTPPDFGGRETSGLLTTATPRWKSLHVLSELDAEYRQRPTWNHTPDALGRVSPGEEQKQESLYRANRVPKRTRIVGLRAAGSVILDKPDLEPFLPAEVVPLIEGPVTPERFSVSVQVGQAESHALSAETLIGQLVETADQGEGPQTRLKEEHLRSLPLAADPSTGKAYLAVVTEVLYVQSLEMTLRNRSTSEPALDASGATAAIRRAEEMNAALNRSGIEDRAGGSIEFGMVTNDALTLRRSWPHPLAAAVRGVTLEVDVATGEVLRTAPLGVELPELESAQDGVRDREESEVLEELRRGAEVEELSPEELRKTRLYWDHGPRLNALNGDLRMSLGGRLHLDAAAFSEDDDINAAFGEPDPGVNVRRAFLQLGGAYKQVDFNFWLNFSDNDLGDFSTKTVNFRNVFIGTWGLPVVGGIRVGYFKEPFGLEETTSSNDITFMERSLTDAFIERRNLGLLFQRRLTGQRRMTVALGFYRDANNDLERGTGFGVTSRMTGTPILTEDGRSVLHLGVSGTYRDPGADGIRFQQRPESHQAQVMADTGTFAADRDLRLGVEVGAVLGSLSLQSETIVASNDNGTGSGDPTFWSTYLMGSYVLTGEHRSYRERVGAFGSVHPDRPFWKGGPGAIEVALRYSYLDLDSEGIDGGELHDWTLGLNWYANLNMRVMFNYIAAHPEGFDLQHTIQARLQFTF